MTADERWIVVPNWGQFQHYKDRDPAWIKSYPRQLSDPDYERLTFHQRGVLDGLRLEYARSNGQIPGSTWAVSRRLGGRVTERTLQALSDAGLIAFVASRPLALARVARDRDREDPPSPPTDAGGLNGRLSKKELARFTGCRVTRGSHGAGFVRDPLGTDKPPPDWPHERPTRDEVEAALTKGER